MVTKLVEYIDLIFGEGRSPVPLVSGLTPLLSLCPCLLSCFFVALRGADDVLVLCHPILRVVKALGRRFGGVGRILLRLGKLFFKLLETLFQIDNLCTRFCTPSTFLLATRHNDQQIAYLNA